MVLSEGRGSELVSTSSKFESMMLSEGPGFSEAEADLDMYPPASNAPY
jgi:hypothetical protein